MKKCIGFICYLMFMLLPLIVTICCYYYADDYYGLSVAGPVVGWYTLGLFSGMFFYAGITPFYDAIVQVIKSRKSSSTED